jgi:hypothetical protein
MDWRPTHDAGENTGTVIMTAAKFLKNISAKDPTHRNCSRWTLTPRRRGVEAAPLKEMLALP